MEEIAGSRAGSGGGDGLTQWQTTLAEGEERARELVRAHPVAALLGAAALGFVIARLVRERF